jgi:hypothetical protein
MTFHFQSNKEGMAIIQQHLAMLLFCDKSSVPSFLVNYYQFSASFPTNGERKEKESEGGVL